MTYECVKTIEKFGVKLKELNYLYGIDFQNFKTIRVYKGHGKSTLSKLSKIYNLSEKNLNLLVIKQTDYFEKKQNKLVQLNNSQAIFVDIRFMGSFTTFQYQYELKNALQNDNLEYILIIIDKEQLKRVKQSYYDVEKDTAIAFINDDENLIRVQKHENNLKYDFIGDGINKNIGCYNCNKKELDNFLNNYTGTWGISIIQECSINNIKCDLNIGGLNIKNLHDYIDKSGYNVYAKREKLQEELLK